MQIYFDDNLVPEDYYMSYSDNFSSFDDSFYLGSSASLNATLQVPIVAWPGIINNVRRISKFLKDFFKIILNISF